MIRAHASQGAALVALLATAAVAGGAHAQSLNEVTRVQREVGDAAIESQKKIDRISDESEELLGQYRYENERIDALEAYNSQLERLIESQNQELAQIEEQVGEVQDVEREILPLMQRMVESVARLIELDLPFLIEERRDRVEMLRSLMDRADVTISEKFRRVLEAYQIESDYGRTVDTYRDEIDLEGGPRIVDVLSVGRVVLLYQTLDGEASGIWDAETRSWHPLPRIHNADIRRGIRIALDQEAPNLLQLPVPAARGES